MSLRYGVADSTIKKIKPCSTEILVAIVSVSSSLEEYVI
jgi:hypothetical protein